MVTHMYNPFFHERIRHSSLSLFIAGNLALFELSSPKSKAVTFCWVAFFCHTDHSVKNKQEKNMCFLNGKK